jgi:hypothetical protein
VVVSGLVVLGGKRGFALGIWSRLALVPPVGPFIRLLSVFMIEKLYVLPNVHCRF